MNAEARYLRASRGAHRAWVASQPQYVIPGLLDGLDEHEVKRADAHPAAASCSSSPLEPPVASPPPPPPAGSTPATRCPKCGSTVVPIPVKGHPMIWPKTCPCGHRLDQRPNSLLGDGRTPAEEISGRRQIGA